MLSRTLKHTGHLRSSLMNRQCRYLTRPSVFQALSPSGCVHFSGGHFKPLARFSFDCRKVIGFALTTLHDWLRKLAHFFVQSEVKPKPIVTRSRSFCRALRQLHVISSNFDWFTVLSESFVIGCSDYFSLGFTTLN